MIKYTAKAEYYAMQNGQQISKKLAQRDYVIMKTWKTYNKIDAYHTQITYIHECLKNPQLNIFKNGK